MEPENLHPTISQVTLLFQECTVENDHTAIGGWNESDGFSLLMKTLIPSLSLNVLK